MVSIVDAVNHYIDLRGQAVSASHALMLTKRKFGLLDEDLPAPAVLEALFTLKPFVPEPSGDLDVSFDRLVYTVI